MNTQQIKASAAAGNSPWEILAQLTGAGMEYPDAEFKVAQALRMRADEVAEMRDAYDNNV